MNTKHRCLVLMACLALLPLTACQSGGRLRYEAMDQPQNVMVNFQRAIANGDREQFIGCFDTAAGPWRTLLDSLFDMSRAAYLARQAIVDRFGSEALEQPGMDPRSFQIVAPGWPQTLRYEPDDGGIRAHDPALNGKGPLLIPFAGEWRLVTAELFRDGTERALESQIAIARRNTDGLTELRHYVLGEAPDFATVRDMIEHLR